MRNESVEMLYVKATLITAATAILIAAGCIMVAWDPTYDSGAAQGFGVGVVALVASVLAVLIIFPVSAYLLQRSAPFNKRKWTRLVFLGIALKAIVISLIANVFAIDGGLFVDVFVLASMLFLIAVILLAPLSYLWLWLARIPHNSAQQPTASGGS